MDPQYEQRLRDEVIYLHSLWHQGPHTPRPAAAAARHNLQPPQTTQFKKEKKPKSKRPKKPKQKLTPESNTSPGVEWPCPTPAPPATAWPSSQPKPDSKPISLSPDEQSKVDSRNAHHHALKSVHEFFRSKHADDSDATDSSSDEDDDESMMDVDGNREDYSFFTKVFNEDTLLKTFYEKNFAKGEFSCLVCGALRGKGTGKKFKGCLALVQHSIAIAKTKKKRSHRAFGQTVCKVLGWDIDNLSSVVSSMNDKLGETEGNNSIVIVNNVERGEGSIGEVVLESGLAVGTVILPNGDEGDMTSLKCPDVDKSVEDLSIVHPHIVEEPLVTEGLTNNSLTCPDADKNLEEPSSEGLTTNSSTFDNANKSIEDLGVAHPNSTEEHKTEVLTSVPLYETNGSEIEVQDLQMGNAVLADGLNEAIENEN